MGVRRQFPQNKVQGISFTFPPLFSSPDLLECHVCVIHFQPFCPGPTHPAMSHLIIPSPMLYRQPSDTITLRPRPPPPATEAGGAPLRGSLISVQLTAEQQPHSGPGGCEVDDGIPEAHQGKHDAGGIGEREGDHGGVDEGIDPVD